MLQSTATPVSQSKEYELFCHGRLEDPYPFFHRLRAEDPVHWCAPLNSWLLTGYADVSMALRESRLLSSERAGFFVSQAPQALQQKLIPLGQHLSKSVVLSDPPNHTRLRGLVNKAFNTSLIQSMAGRIQQIVDALLDEIQDQGESDLVCDFAYRLPATVISEILGVPTDHHNELRQWTEDFNAFNGGSSLNFAETAEKAQHSLLEMTDYFRGIMSERRRQPREDLISAMIKAEEQGDMLTEDELLSMCSTLFVAGHDTTRNLIGNGMLALLQNPDQLARLKADPSLIPSAVEEFLRFESPFQRMSRVAKEHLEIGGKRIRKGQAVLEMLGAANRDPQQFSDPDRLDVSRQPNRHVAFGVGIHFCIGAPLARVEAPIAFRSILDRLSSIRLGTSAIEWRESIAVRGLKSLPIVFKSAQQRTGSA